MIVRCSSWSRVPAWTISLAVPLGALGLMDHRWGAFSVTGFGAPPLEAALLAVLVALLAPHLKANVLPVAAMAAALASLGVASAVHAMDSSDGDRFTGLDGYAFTEPVALVVVLGFVTWRATPVAVTVTAPALLAAVVLRPLAGGVRDTVVAVSLFLALIAFAVVGAGLAARLVAADRRRRETALQLRQRTEFARDLHDFVAHHVTGIVVLAQGAGAVAAKKPELLPPALERIEQAGTEALESMHRMVGMLREPDDRVAPRPVADLGGAVRRLVERFELPGARTELVEEGEPGPLLAEVATTAHHVVMEALTNVRKHARHCTSVEVRLTHTGDTVRVRVSNDGGRRRSTGGRFGLRGLEERVAMIGGTLRSGPAARGGWLVEAVLPTGTAPTNASSPPAPGQGHDRTQRETV